MAKYYVVTPHKIYTAKTPVAMNQLIKGVIEPADYKSHGSDFIINLDNSDIAFIQDKRSLSKIAFNKLFAVENNNALQILMLIMLLITMIKA